VDDIAPRSESPEVNPRVSYWLMPTEPDKAQLTKIIPELSRRVDAPKFGPHVMIYSGPLAPDEDVGQITASATIFLSADGGYLSVPGQSNFLRSELSPGV
jgi:hypothetical protein